MSHWMVAKAEGLKCSLAVLRKHLAKIMPAWEKAIEVHPGGIELTNTYDPGRKELAHLVVRRNKITDRKYRISYTDLGFRCLGDPNDPIALWEIPMDNSGVSVSVPAMIKDIKRSINKDKYIKEARRREMTVKQQGNKLIVVGPQRGQAMMA